MTTFAYSPDSGASENVAPRVLTAKFGDGYQQRVGDGINTRPRSWNLSFTGEASRIDAIEAIFVAANGVDSFDWTPPHGAAGKFICSSWSRGVPALVAGSITATFTEVFGE